MMLIGKLTKEHLHNSNLLQMISLPTLLLEESTDLSTFNFEEA
jgi:hypothetical protein